MPSFVWIILMAQLLHCLCLTFSPFVSIWSEWQERVSMKQCSNTHWMLVGAQNETLLNGSTVFSIPITDYRRVVVCVSVEHRRHACLFGKASSASLVFLNQTVCTHLALDTHQQYAVRISTSCKHFRNKLFVVHTFFVLSFCFICFCHLLLLLYNHNYWNCR